MLIKLPIVICTFCMSLIYSLPEVQISNGILQGTIYTTRRGRNVSAFLGIPYAEPPIGKLRFSNPEAKKSWKNVFQATQDGNQCPQLSGIWAVGNEDCLYLNVFAPMEPLPKSTIGRLLPVMVWIHGGTFISGNGSSTNYGPKYLLDRDVVYVSMNYRLGIFGFLSTGDESAPGNFGLKDQVLALKWVQKNIQAFGGDPQKVTIFGQSAGSVCVGLHVLSDASNGLFNQYIVQSGSVLVPWGFQERDQYKLYSKKIALLNLCPFFNSQVMINCLRNKDYRQLLQVSSVFNTIARFAQVSWTPTDEPESEDAFLTDSPENLISKNKMKDLAFITGNVANEGEVLAKVLYKEDNLYEAIKGIIKNVIDYFIGYYLKSNDVKKFRNEIIDFYFGGSIPDNKDKFIHSLSNFLDDASFFYPEVKFLEKSTNKVKSPFYFYIFNYQGAIVPESEKYSNFTGVGHSEDLFYLFPFEFVRSYSYGFDQNIIDLMVDLWTSFAINGNPKSKNLENPDLWMEFSNNKSYLYIKGDFNNESTTLEKHFFKDRVNFWKNRDSTP